MKKLKFLVTFMSIILTTFSNGIDNFHKRMEYYNNRISNAYSTMEICDELYNYQKALDKELNNVYQLLQKELNSEEKLALKNSQLKWIDYRNKEFDLINFMYNSGGTIDSIDIISKKNNFIEKRIEELYEYTESHYSESDFE